MELTNTEKVDALIREYPEFTCDIVRMWHKDFQFTLKTVELFKYLKRLKRRNNAKKIEFEIYPHVTPKGHSRCKICVFLPDYDYKVNLWYHRRWRKS